MKIGTRPKIGLALGSGVARGWAHIGVIRALEKLDLAPDVVAGTSIGAVVGGMWLAGKLDHLDAWARALTRTRMIKALDLAPGTGGLFAGAKLVRELEDHLEETRIEDLPRSFTAVATDLSTGHEVWLREGAVAGALRASFALPGVFSPIRHGHRFLVDGALVNPVPVSVCRALGADVVIAVNLNSEMLAKTLRSYRPATCPPNKAGVTGSRRLSRIPAAMGFDVPANGWFGGMFGREAAGPSLVGSMVASLNIIQDRITRSRLAGEPPDISINPRVGRFGLLEFHRAAEIIEEGKRAVDAIAGDLADTVDTIAGTLR